MFVFFQSGGVDFVHVGNMKDLLTEGHRMSKNLGIKCSLAGIWYGTVIIILFSIL